MRDRLTTDKTKIFARENPTLMSITKDELRKLYNEVFDRLQEYEVAEEQGQIIVPPCKVGDKVYINNHEITIDEVFLGEELLFSTYFDCDWVMENIGCEDCPFADWEQTYEGEWDCRTRGYFSFAEKDIGKTVFLTKEEAEQAKKGGVQE